jgi:hypothetical protein
MSESIKFKAAYGDFDKEIELNRLMVGYWHIHINRYYKDQVIFRQGAWEVSPQHDHYFTIDDMDVISELVTEYDKKQDQYNIVYILNFYLSPKYSTTTIVFESVN